MLKKLKQYAPLQVITAGSLFAIIAIHTRFLSVADYGSLALIISTVEFTVICLVQWLITTFLRFYSSSQNKEILFGKIVLYILVMSLIGFLLITLLAYYSDFIPKEYLYLIIGLFISRTIYTFLLEFVRIVDRVNIYRAAVIMQSTISVFLTVTMLYISPIVENALISLLIGYTLSAIYIFITAKPKVSYSFSIEHDLMKYALPILVSNILVFTANRSDRFILSHFSSKIELGYYAGMSSIAIGLVSLVFMVVAQTLYPEMVKYSDQKSQLKKQQLKYGFIVFSISIPAVFLMLAIEKEVILFMLGDKFASSDVRVFGFLVLTAFFYNCKVHFFDHAIQFSKNTSFIMYVSIFSVLFLFALILAFKDSINAYTLSILVCVTGLFSLICTYAAIKWKRAQFYFPPHVFSCLFMTMASYLTVLFVYDLLELNMSLFFAILTKSLTFVFVHVLIILTCNYGGLRTKILRYK